MSMARSLSMREITNSIRCGHTLTALKFMTIDWRSSMTLNLKNLSDHNTKSQFIHQKLYKDMSLSDQTILFILLCTQTTDWIGPILPHYAGTYFVYEQGKEILSSEQRKIEFDAKQEYLCSEGKILLTKLPKCTLWEL